MEASILAVGVPELPRPNSSHTCGKTVTDATLRSHTHSSSLSTSATSVPMSDNSGRGGKTGGIMESTKSYSSALVGQKGEDLYI